MSSPGSNEPTGEASTGASFFARISHLRAAAGALITDERGNVLLVEPTYKDQWEIPGGVVEEGESPIAACARELEEELGLALQPGRLLVIEYKTEPQPRGDSIMFVYDGGVLRDVRSLRLATQELRSVAFVPRGELVTRLTKSLARRLDHALEARATGATLELVNGVLR